LSLLEPNCKQWEGKNCVFCEVPISFFAVLSKTTIPFACTHMPEGASVEVKFEGLFITVNASEPDNKVWNTWIIASAKGLSACTPTDCKDQRISPGLGSNGPVTLVRVWKTFDFDGIAKVKSGIAQVQLYIDGCSAGPLGSICDSSPPGTGSNYTAEGVTNRGFPDYVPYPPPPGKVRFRVQ
jgi:hypothetical protein